MNCAELRSSNRSVYSFPPPSVADFFQTIRCLVRRTLPRVAMLPRSWFRARQETVSAPIASTAAAKNFGEGTVTNQICAVQCFGARANLPFRAMAENHSRAAKLGSSHASRASLCSHEAGPVRGKRQSLPLSPVLRPLRILGCLFPDGKPSEVGFHRKRRAA